MALPVLLGLLLWWSGAPLVRAHGGIESGESLFTAWNSNLLPSLGLFVAAFLYVNGLNRWDRPSHPLSIWQRLSFFAGLGVIFLALQSPIDTLAEHQFSVHQVQHLLLRMVGPLLVLAGAPLTPMLRGLPIWALQGLVKPLVGSSMGRKAYDALTNPVLTTLAFLAVLYLWQEPTLHNMALRDDWVHVVMHSTMLTSGFLFWWLVVDPKPHRSRLHYGLRVLYLGLIVIPNTVLGAAITFQSEPIYDAYRDYPQPYSMSPLVDQQLGGLFLWVVGDMMSVLIAGVVMAMWYQKEREHDIDAASFLS